LASITSPDTSSFPIVRIAAVGTAEQYSSVGRLEELQERRAYECRLTPDRALDTLDDAEAFLRDRGMLTRTADSALPSLFEACHEDPYAPGSRGFGQWPATKYPWFGELAERGYLILKVHRGKSLLVTDEAATLIDPIVRAELERMEQAAPDWAMLLRHLAAAGPSTLEDLQTELDLKPKELKAIRYPLERCGAVVARSLVYAAGEGHGHSAELSRWDQAFSTAGETGVQLRQACADLVVAGVRAAVVAPERELRRWFSWPWYWDDALLETLVEDGRLERVDGHVAAVE
jgi:hypothetical protein